MELSKEHFLRQSKFDNHLFGANQRKMLISSVQEINAYVDDNQLDEQSCLSIHFCYNMHDPVRQITMQ